MFLRKHGEKFIQSSPCFFRKEKIHFYRFKLESKAEFNLQMQQNSD